MSSSFTNAHHVKIGGDVVTSHVINNHYNESSSKHPLERLQEHIAAGALHNSAERSDAPKCHPETRVAVQEEVVGWICDGDSDDDPKEIMWVSGPAGSGKTAIMGSVADTCQGKDILAGTHFFSSFSGSADRRSKRYLVPTLAYQLVQHQALSQVAHQIFSAIEHNPAIFEQKLEVQLDQLILEPLRACRDRPQLPEWPKVILIDGLDECEADQYDDTTRSNAHSRSKENDQIEILSILKKATSDPDFPFRIVIASRPEHAITSFFTEVAHSMTRKLFLDEKYNPDADMELFLETKFAKIRRQCHLPPSWPSEDVRQTLIANASGQFIYVATVGRFMEESDGDPAELLDRVLQLPGIKPSANPLAPLDALYAHILSSSPDPHLSTLWLNLIFREKWLDYDGSGLRRPRPTPAPAAFVRLFLESYPGQASHVFKNLNSLVSVPSMEDEESSYRLYHKSLVDFLVERSRSADLYVEPKVVSKHLVDRYLHLWKGGGPNRPLEDVDKVTIFFESFFSRSIFLQVLSAESLSCMDEIVLSCDLAWWVESFRKFGHGGSASAEENLSKAFNSVHEMCHWYTCRPSCRHIRSGMIKALKAADWKTPSRWQQLVSRYFYLRRLVHCQ